MDGGVGRILELLGDEIAIGIGRGEFFRAPDGALHAFGAGSEDEVGAEGGEDAAAFDAHGFGHGQRELIAACGGDVGECDAGVSAGGFHDFDAGTEEAAFFGVPDHGGADAAFDGVGGVTAFDFGQDGCLGINGDAIQADERGIADGFRIILENAAHWMPP